MSNSKKGRVRNAYKNQFSNMIPIAFHLFGPIHESTLYDLRGNDVQKIIRKNTDEFLKKMAELNMVKSDLKHQIYSSALNNWQKSNLNDCMESISMVSLQANETKDKNQQIMVCHSDHNLYAEGITMEYPLKLCLPAPDGAGSFPVGN